MTVDPKQHLIDVVNSKHRGWLRRLWVCLEDQGVEVDGAYESPYFEGACVTGYAGSMRFVFRIAATTFESEKQSPYYVAQRCMNGLDDTPYLIWSALAELKKLRRELDDGI